MKRLCAWHCAISNYLKLLNRAILFSGSVPLSTLSTWKALPISFNSHSYFNDGPLVLATWRNILKTGSSESSTRSAKRPARAREAQGAPSSPLRCSQCSLLLLPRNCDIPDGLRCISVSWGTDCVIFLTPKTIWLDATRKRHSLTHWTPAPLFRLSV